MQTTITITIYFKNCKKLPQKISKIYIKNRVKNFPNKKVEFTKKNGVKNVTKNQVKFTLNSVKNVCTFTHKI